MTKQYRATIVRDNGKEEDWGFYDLRVMDNTVFIRTSNDFPQGAYDAYIAAGTWREIRDMFWEDDDE